MPILNYALCVAAGLAAWLALWGRADERFDGVLAYVMAATAGDGLSLADPTHFWTPTACLLRELLTCLACALAALEIGRVHLAALRPGWTRAGLAIIVQLLALGSIGALGLAGIDDTPRSGYRGLVVVYAATAAVLAVVLLAIRLHGVPIRRVSAAFLQGALGYLLVQMLYVGSWEASQDLAAWSGWAASGAYVAFMLVLAQAAFRTYRPQVLASRMPC